MTEQIPFELASLSKAKNYQKWIYESVQSHLGNRILEVGAGIGNLSSWMPLREKLVLAEVEESFIPMLEKLKKESFRNDERVIVKQVQPNLTWLEELRPLKIDTVVSFNVLEHIEEDGDFLGACVKLLRENPDSESVKRIVTLVPAHNFAFGTLDRKFGHFRRYDKKTFAKTLAPIADSIERVEYRYMNPVGLLGWFTSGVVLKKSAIGTGSIRIFDFICPVLAWVEKFLPMPFGQSLVAVVTLKKSRN